MKYFTIIFCLIIFSFSAFSQNAEKILAAADGIKITSKDLPAGASEFFTSLPKLLAERRVALLNEQITEVLLETEAESRKITVEKLIETEISAKIPTPTDEQIKAIYEVNRAQIGDKTLDDVRLSIIGFLRREPEQKAYDSLFSKLKAKHKIALGKDVTAPNLKITDILATVGSRQITVKDFDDHNKPKLADFEGDFYDRMKFELEEAVFNLLVSAEAKMLGIGANDLIAREMTDKMREFSDEESGRLKSDLRNKLFSKYNAKILLEEPAPFVQNVSADDDPAQGNVKAAVTVVMFSDFQCPTCASIHPILKKIISGYGNQVRFVVRDFPLMSIHNNAFRAALAANAAGAQGKFFEYTELLYKNQDHLDAESLKKYAADAGLNIRQFELDLENEKFAEEVRKDLSDGTKYGVSGTPTIFVNGVKVRTLSAQSFKNAIDKALKK